MKNEKIVINIQTTMQSIVSDAFSIISAIALIGSGVWAESSAMQWVGFILFFIMLLARSNIPGVYRVKTIEQARNILDKIEKDAANG